MPTRIDLPLEIVARNNFYKNDRRRAWALVAYMVEHEELEDERAGTEQDRNGAREQPRVFRGYELNQCVLPPRAGYGGYSHPGAAGLGRTNVIRALTGDAEREGWITRERDRYGGVQKYALTEAGREIYRKMIKPQRDAFVAAHISAATAPTGATGNTSLRPALTQAENAAAELKDFREKRIAEIQKRYESVQIAEDRDPTSRVGRERKTHCKSAHPGQAIRVEPSCGRGARDLA
jgi:DNA-binding MarR family transcriptional regulator